MGRENIIDKDKEYFYELALGDELKEAEWGLEFTSVIILPTSIHHDSGFNIMWFILLDNEENPIAKATGGADVMKVWRNPDDWHLDCLPCGLLRFFHFGQDSKVFYNGMEFEFYPAGNKNIGEYEIKGE